MRRRFVVEWWEVWWKKRGSQPVLHEPIYRALNTLIPRHGFVTEAMAKEYIDRERNKYLKMIHVRRYKKRK